MKQMQGKLHSGRGFTLTELLAVVLILLLVTAIVAGGIPAAVRVYQNVVDVANAQVLLNTTLTVLRDELSRAASVDPAITAATGASYSLSNEAEAAAYAGVFFSNETGMESDLSTKIVSTEDGIKIQEYLNSAYSVYGVAIEEYREPRPLVSLAAESQGRLIPRFESITYDRAAGLFTITKLTVYKEGGEKPLAELERFTIRAVAVPVA